MNISASFALSCESIGSLFSNVRAKPFCVSLTDSTTPTPTSEPSVSSDPVKSAAEEQARLYVEGFKNYGMLLGTMSPQEFSAEIGKHFRDPHQAAILSVLLARIITLETKLANTSK